MGITPLTLALASTRGTKIPDHLNDEMVLVRVVGYTENRHPIFVLEYENGTIREVKWLDGQAYAGDIVELCSVNN